MVSLGFTKSGSGNLVDSMKICIIGNEYKQQFPLVGYGGIESCVEQLVLGFQKYFANEHKFCVIVPKIRFNKKSYDFNIIETNFIESSVTGIPFDYFAYEVRDMIKSAKSKPDIIWCQSAWSRHFAELDIPIICTIHDSGGWEDGKFIFKENFFYRFISKFQYDLVFKDADQNPIINKIKSQSFYCLTGAVDDEYDLETNKSDYVLWVAGFNWGFKAKGLDIFIELAKLRNDQTFVAYGAGDAHIENHLKQLSQQIKNFHYMGQLERGQAHKDTFKKAKMFAFLTQIDEASGRTGLEAITKGTPILGSTRGAVPELYTPAGICTDNIEEMSKALDYKFNYNSIYEYSQRFHVKNEIQFLLEKSKLLV